MTTSTIAVAKNWWILAGSNVTVPTFFDIGNIAIIASSEINTISKGNAALVAGNTALIASGSNITLYCSTLTDIQSPIISFSTPQFNVGASNTTFNGTVNINKSLTASTINTRYASISSIVNVSSINGAVYPPTNGSATVTSTFTTLFTSTISGNPLNYLSLIANRSITMSALTISTVANRAVFTGDVKVSSLNGAAVGGGGGGWVGTATSALNMGTYAINGSALTINSSNSGDFTIKNQAGSGASLNLIGDTYVFFQSRQYDMYFDPHTDIGGNAPGNFNFGGNNFYANSYQAMYFTNYGTSGYGMNFQSGDRIFMNSATQFTAKCTGLHVELNGYGGVQIVDSTTGGSGYLTVDSGNHLYWNGVYIA